MHSLHCRSFFHVIFDAYGVAAFSDHLGLTLSNILFHLSFFCRDMERKKEHDSHHSSLLCLSLDALEDLS
jgi:hypothetical protein